MGKKVFAAENMNQKLGLAIRSGKYKIGKFYFNANCVQDSSRLRSL